MPNVGQRGAPIYCFAKGIEQAAERLPAHRDSNWIFRVPGIHATPESLSWGHGHAAYYPPFHLHGDLADYLPYLCTVTGDNLNGASNFGDFIRIEFHVDDRSDYLNYSAGMIHSILPRDGSESI